MICEFSIEYKQKTEAIYTMWAAIFAAIDRYTQAKEGGGSFTGKRGDDLRYRRGRLVSVDIQRDDEEVILLIAAAFKNLFEV